MFYLKNLFYFKISILNFAFNLNLPIICSEIGKEKAHHGTVISNESNNYDPAAVLRVYAAVGAQNAQGFNILIISLEHYKIIYT